MDIEEYAKSGQRLYADFAETVGSILEQAIAASPLQGSQPQLQHRAKDVARLKARLEEQGLGAAPNIEEIRKDLAGCRLIFYTNGDLTAFLSQRILNDNFEIDYDSTKVHHPTARSENESQYRGYNFVVKMKESREQLPEYARFAGLRCEVQLQTILNHAWSETSHDIVYKQSFSTEYTKKALAQIKKRFDDIMLKYLVPAGHEFEKAKQDFNRLVQGKPIFEKGPLKALRDAADNNERKDVLDRIQNHYLPNHDDPRPLLPELYATVEEAVTLSRGTPAAKINTTFGTTDGWTGEHVVDAALDLLDSFRFADPEATLSLLMSLLKAAQGKSERERVLKSVESLAHVPINVFRQVGGKVQLLLVRKLSGLGKEDRQLLRALILKVCEEVLEPEVTGSTGSYRKVTFERGALPADKDIEVARRQAIEVLKVLYGEASTDAERISVLNILSRALRTPMQANYSSELLAIIFSDSLRVMTFLSEISASASFEVKKTIEGDAWEAYRTLGLLTSTDDPEGELAKLQAALREELKRVRDILDGDQEFEIFKTLVSLNAVYPPAWETPKVDFRRDDAWRNTRIGDYVEAFTKETEAAWWHRLDRCASSPTNDGAGYRGLQEFLERVGKTKPELILPHMDSLSEAMIGFLPTILPALWRSKEKDALHELLLRWVKEGKHLRAIARHYEITKEPDLDVLSAVLRAAQQAGDQPAVLTVIRTLVATYGRLGPARKELLLCALDWLQSRGSADWVGEAWFLGEGLEAFARELSSEERTRVLGTLVPYKEPDHHVDYIVAPFAKVDLQSVLTYFGARLKYAAGKPRDLKYTAIPYAITEMKALQEAPDAVVDAALNWLRDGNLKEQGAGSFVHAVFSQLTDDLVAILIKRGTSGDRKQIEGVLDILSNYEGVEQVYKVCREIVGSIDPGDNALVKKVWFALEHTGTVTGEFGFVESYTAQKKFLETWLDDPRAEVKAFARDLIARFEQAIASEQNRAEQSMALDKLNWGEPITDTD